MNINDPRIKIVVFLVCSAPLWIWLVEGFSHRLGANPPETLSHGTGIWALRLLVVTLAISPLQRWTGWSWLLNLRRSLGLFAFFYACLHVLVYVLFDHAFDMADILEDLRKRSHLVAGFVGFVLMAPLAITSSDAMVRWVGRQWWQRLHRLVYLCAIAAVVHYFWLVKQDILPPALYALVVVILLGLRLPRRRRGPMNLGVSGTSHLPQKPRAG